MSRVPTVLGLDLGTSAVKAMLVDPDGVVRAIGRQTYETIRPAMGHSEQRPSDWLVAAAGAIRQALAQDDVDVEAIGLSGHMSAPVLIDAAGQALAPCHTIADSRAETDIPADCRDEIAARTGNVCAPYFSLPKLLWWRRHHPDVLARARHVLSPKDYLAAWLTGETASEPTDAGNMLLLDARTRRWMPDLARAVGLDPGLLPPLAEPGTALGRLRGDVAHAIGLKAGLPVAMGAADMAAALLGAGIAADEVAVTIGTSATVIAAMEAIDPILMGRVTFHSAVTPGRLYALGSHFGGGACLDWLAGILGGSERLREAADAAAAIPKGAEGLVFVPYLLGAGSPDFDPSARGAFLGLAASHGPAHLLRAVVEGVTADLCRSIELLDPANQARALVLAGGGANLRIWPQALADFAARPVVVTSSHDASTMGAAVLAGVRLGWFGGSVEAAGRRSRPRSVPIQPASQDAVALRRRFENARQGSRAA